MVASASGVFEALNRRSASQELFITAVGWCVLCSKNLPQMNQMPKQMQPKSCLSVLVNYNILKNGCLIGLYIVGYLTCNVSSNVNSKHLGKKRKNLNVLIHDC